MKKGLFILAAGLAAFWFLQPTDSPRTRAGSSVTRPRKAAAPAVTASSVPAKVISADSPRAPAAELLDCEERARSTYQPDSRYIDRMKSELDRVIGDWYYKKDPSLASSAREQGTAGRFLLALAKAGLLSGLEVARDDDSAIQILSEVYREDPRNSAPAIFAATIEERRGRTEEAAVWVRRANDSSQFNSYLLEFTRALFAGVRTPSELLSAQEIWATAPVPNYGPIQEMMVRLHLPFLAEQMMNDGFQNNLGPVDLSWVPIEYAVGLGAWKKMKMTADYPEYRDLMAKRQIPESEMSCDGNDLLRAVEYIQRTLTGEK